MVFLLALALVLLQLTGVWLRYLPFARSISYAQRRNLQQLSAGWGILALLAYTSVMTVYDGDVLRFKLFGGLWLDSFLSDFVLLYSARLCAAFICFGHAKSFCDTSAYD